MIRHHLPSLEALKIFESAARLGSFKDAAAELFVSPTAVSHRIRTLEDSLGCALFTRKVRAVVLTPEGHALQLTLRGSLDAIATTVERIRRPSRHSITLSVTPEFATQWLVPKLADFQAAHPDIDLHVHASYSVVDLNAGAADLVVRYGNGLWTDVQMQPLFQERFVPVAAPALKQQLSDDPTQWPLIHMNWYLPAQQAFDWTRWAAAAGVDADKLRPGTRYSDGTHAVQAAVAGQGVALLGVPLLEKELRMKLLEVVTGPELPGQFYYVCTPAKRAVSTAVRTLEQWLLARKPRLG
ncbi:MAG: LysR substrate-binding domain-containing protein [Lautropia sp.]|nr:LysR substrate-binding domain-containing protein [Lautropia sp.]